MEVIVRELGHSQHGPISPVFLQSEFWARFKSGFGWRPRQFVLTYDHRDFPFLVLEKPLFLGKKLAYVPHGPLLPIPEEDNKSDIYQVSLDYPENPERADWAFDPSTKACQLLENLALSLKPFFTHGYICLRFDLAYYSRQAGLRLRPLSLRRSAVDVQPPDTVILDLRKSESELLSDMRPKWRYNIKLAAKKGVLVECLSEKSCTVDELHKGIERFYCLYLHTAERDKIAIHPISYYQSLFNLAREDNELELNIFFAVHEGEYLAAIIVLRRGFEAVYLYGASSSNKRNVMPAYALQWEAIRQVKAKGARWYDFYGVPPTADPSHPMHGLYLFKTGFGGEVIHRLGCYDLRLSLLYTPYALAERARLFYFKRIKKINLRRKSKGLSGPSKDAQGASKNTSPSKE